jgi:DNA-binding protein HU-beta
MNKQDLIAQVAARMDVSRRVATDAVEAVVESISSAVERGEKAVIPGFGTFEGVLRAPRRARNPQTGESVTVPARVVPSFRAGSDLRARVARGTTRKR